MAKRAAGRKDFSLMTFLNYPCPFSTRTNWPQFDIYNGNLNAMGEKKTEKKSKTSWRFAFLFLFGNPFKHFA